MKSSARRRPFIRVYQDGPPFCEEHAGGVCRQFDALADTNSVEIDAVQKAGKFLDQSNPQTHDEV
jgi:hypothetical protein